MTSDPVGSGSGDAGWRAKLLAGDRHALEATAASALIALSVFLAGVLLARVLGAEGRGRVAAHMVGVAASVALGSLGSNYGAAFAAARNGALRSVFGAALRLGAVAVLATAGLDIGYELWLLRFGSATETAWAIAGAVLSQAAAVTFGWLQGARSFRAWNALRLVAYGLYPLLLVALQSVGALGVAGALAAYAAPQGLALIGGLAVGLASAQPERGTVTTTMAAIWKYERFAGVSTGLYHVNQRLDQIVLGALHWTGDLGIYASTVALSGLAIALVAGLAQVTYGEGLHIGPAERRRLLDRRLAVAVGCAATCALLLSIAPGWLMSLLFGPAFASGAGALVILAWGTVFITGNYVAAESVRSGGDSRTPMRADLVATAVTVVGLPLAIREFGILGAAAVSGCAYAATFAMNYGAARRALREAAIPGDLLREEMSR